MPTFKLHDRFAHQQLTQEDLDRISRFTRTPMHFCEYMKSIKTVDLSPFANSPNLTEIDENFMCNMDDLVSVDFTSLHRVTVIESWFMYECKKLPSIDLSPFSNVDRIGLCFLYGCEALTSLDLTALKNISKIPDFFLKNCSSLTSVNISTLDRVAVIGVQCMMNCDKMNFKQFDLTPFSKNLEFVGKEFLADCLSSSIRDLDLTPFFHLKSENVDDEDLVKEIAFQKRRAEAVRKVNLVAFKSCCRIGKGLLGNEWYPRKLVFAFCVPVRDESI